MWSLRVVENSAIIDSTVRKRAFGTKGSRGQIFLDNSRTSFRENLVCDAICQEWYPLFENHFLFGTVLADFSFESRIICPDHDFCIGKYRYFRRGSIGDYRNGSLNVIQG